MILARRDALRTLTWHQDELLITALYVAVDLASQGVVCVRSNAVVASSVSVLFVCCLPAQLPLVAADIRESLDAHTIVFSVVTAVPVSRLKRLLGTANVVRPEMEMENVAAPQQSLKWDVSRGVGSAFELTDVVEMTCPLSENKSGNVGGREC
jgi:hypothetical protein